MLSCGWEVYTAAPHLLARHGLDVGTLRQVRPLRLAQVSPEVDGAGAVVQSHLHVVIAGALDYQPLHVVRAGELG